MKPEILVNLVPQNNARNMAPDKETIETRTLVGMSDGRLKEFAVVRVYAGRSKNSNRVWASIWVWGNKDGQPVYAGGHGMASGYGYDKGAAATTGAMQSAGFKLTWAEDGRTYSGDCGPDKACRLIAQYFGLTEDQFIIV